MNTKNTGIFLFSVLVLAKKKINQKSYNKTRAEFVAELMSK
jgi:hypothetical protein